MTSFVKPHSTAQMPGVAIPKAKKSFRPQKTTFIEKLLLISTIIILPLENHIPTVGGRSVVFILFAVIACYVCLNRPQSLNKTFLHPVFLAAYGLIFVGVTVESFHSNSSYFILFRFGAMVLGAILVASLCRDKDALSWACYGFLVAGVFMSALLFMTSYGTLSAATATNFHEASTIRGAVFNDNPLDANLNQMGVIAGLGLVVAVAFALSGGSSLKRSIMIGVAVFCLVGTLLPMSRSAFVAALASVSAMLFVYGLGIRIIALMIVLGMAVMIGTPDVVLNRMSFSTEKTSSGKIEARARVYSAALETIGEYPLVGVGAGNYWGPWGVKSKFMYIKKHVLLGPHSGFFAIAIYWGCGALVGLLLVVYQAYRCIPRKCGRDPRSLCLLGLSISLLFALMTAHSLSAKSYSLGLGILVASRYWIWPQGKIPSVPRRNDGQKVRHTNPDTLSH